MIKLGIAVGIIILCGIFRRLYEHLFMYFGFTSEDDYHFNIFLCILLAAWIVKDGIW